MTPVEVLIRTSAQTAALDATRQKVRELGQEAGRVAAWVPGVLIHEDRVHVPTEASLAVIGTILALAIALSVAFPEKK